MFRIRHVLNLSIILILMGMTACNLSLGVPIPTLTPSVIQTIAPFPTLKPVSTITPLPTQTVITQPTSNVPPPYTVNQSVPGPVCSVSPNVTAANIRSGPGISFPVIGVLPANNWLSAARQDGSGWYQIAYAGTVVNGGWISNTVVVLQQPCSCGPNSCTVVNPPPPATFTPIPTATYQPPPNQCTMTVLTPSDIVNVYSQPTSDASIWGTLSAGTYAAVAGRTNDGWYGFDPGVAQAANVGIYRLRWVRSDARITLTGAPCGTLPTIDVSYPPAGDCLVSPVNVSSVTIYNQSGYDAGASGTLTAGSSLPVVGKTPANVNGADNGWYAVDPGIAQAGTIGKYRLRWIPIDNTVAITGADCATLPTVTLDP